VDARSISDHDHHVADHDACADGDAYDSSVPASAQLAIASPCIFERRTPLMLTFGSFRSASPMTACTRARSSTSARAGMRARRASSLSSRVITLRSTSRARTCASRRPTTAFPAHACPFLTVAPTATRSTSPRVYPCTAHRHSSFYYTPDQRLAVTGGTTCLDFGDDITPGYATPLEFQPCKTGDANQIFTLEDVKATVTSTTAFPDPTTICHIGDQEILTPSAGTNLTTKYPTGKVPFHYCSAQYFETSSVNITVSCPPPFRSFAH
jgi:hypothetical protein